MKLTEQLVDINGNPLFPGAAAMADGAANPTTAPVDARLSAWNGATWDRVRSLVDVPLLASAARTANVNSAITPLYNARGVALHLTFGSGAGSIPNTAETLTLAIYDDGPGNGAGPTTQVAKFTTPEGSTLQANLGESAHLILAPGASAGNIQSGLGAWVAGALLGSHATFYVLPSGSSAWTYRLDLSLLP